jgi:COP9 signalosome complex subunit 1
MEAGELQNIGGYLFKAKQVTNIPELQKVKLDSISAMMQLSQSNYKVAANMLCQLPFGSSEFLWKYIAPKDVAIYGGLCALASFDRNELKTLVIENASFKQFLELEPQVREMIRAFYSSKFKSCFEILNSVKNELSMDLFLASKIESMYSLIRSRAMLQYCSPFLSLDLHQMAEVFSCTVNELETQIASLITSNQLDARIDSHNKVKLCNSGCKSQRHECSAKGLHGKLRSVRKVPARSQIQYNSL